MKSLPFFLNKIESLRLRSKALTGLRRELQLPAERDISAEQWDALENQLSGISNTLLKKLRVYADRLLSEGHQPAALRQLVTLLGTLEMEVSQSFSFYDTYMDLLTQRLSQPIGKLLKGCDVIAADGLQRGFLADISLPPLVFCDRGFGAFTCREGVNLLPNAPNPIQFIAVPYARLVEKYNLVSVYHEVGHQALVKLNMLPLLQHITETRMLKAGASPAIAGFFATWIRELGPDFWAFCLTGMAQTCSLRDVLFMAPEQAMAIHTGGQHPPSYLRMLASVAWCRHLWGRGDWDAWEAAWKEKYPLTLCNRLNRELLTQAEQLLPILARILCDTRFKKFNNQPITSLFSLSSLAPETLKALTAPGTENSPAFAKLPAGVQLAAFRLMRDKRQVKAKTLDAAMSRWLETLPDKRNG